jgi:hypothetical protein
MSDELPGRILYIETSAITNDVLRAMAGAHRLCVGYPDGIPEVFGVAPGYVMPNRPVTAFDLVCRPDQAA